MGNHLKEYYANVIDSVGDGVIVFDRQAAVTLINPAAEEITGISRRQAQGHLPCEIFSGVDALLEMVEKTAATGMTISDHENIALAKGGQVKPVSATTS